MYHVSSLSYANMLYLRQDHQAKHEPKQDEIETIHPPQKYKVGCHRRPKMTYEQERRVCELETVTSLLEIDYF